MHVLIVLTSHSRLGDTGEQTGFWLEEFANPYYLFQDQGARIRLASPAGGAPPIDPKSNEPDAQTDATRRLAGDPEARSALAGTHRLRGIRAEDYDAVFYPGGCFIRGARIARLTHRLHFDPDRKYDWVGVRAARSIR